MARMLVTILGCGSSGGVPRVAQGWGKCDPAEPRNRRRRCSILIERHDGGGTTRILVDTSPDLREQLIDAGVRALDAVVFTHEHADHTHGIDDLRPLVLAMRRRIPIHADERTLALLHARFGYCFATPAGSDYPPILTDHLIAAGTDFTIDGAGGPVRLQPFRLEHGNIDALGFRIGGFAYAPDVSAIPAESLAAVSGLDCWVLDALRDTPHPTHFSLGEALGWIARMRPARAVLTNLHTDLDYGRLVRELPKGIEPAYDGLQIAWDDSVSEETSTSA
ncbi:MAG: MBL fold metallo-hydrolase [Hyphomicrobiales bacterium]|uniref:MBL fold metallo-hydrolase n=1 Tax=Rhabdaerophilum calidifontis TaxID=2604328 RepID=UPI00123B97D0|nr:MBL fold metallo-hydrolase [Rhabdaerophilum calidifontis]MCA1952376.1 MBL fold metallo-hydrolase [Hyphomicrobiales bacterium]MCA1999180.1 MBL fold metallo-hydrolase [Hyphomicrobiales bacterium]